MADLRRNIIASQADAKNKIWRTQTVAATEISFPGKGLGRAKECWVVFRSIDRSSVLHPGDRTLSRRRRYVYVSADGVLPAGAHGRDGRMHARTNRRHTENSSA